MLPLSARNCFLLFNAKTYERDHFGKMFLNYERRSNLFCHRNTGVLFKAFYFQRHRYLWLKLKLHARWASSPTHPLGLRKVMEGEKRVWEISISLYSEMTERVTRKYVVIWKKHNPKQKINISNKKLNYTSSKHAMKTKFQVPINNRLKCLL